jgi:hypothetical protein
MPKHAHRLLERSRAIPSKSQREGLAAPGRAQPLGPGAILQRAVLAPQSLRTADILRLQQTLGNRAVAQMLSQSAENPTGLPDQLKAGIETLSGLSLDDVRVHLNSPKPAQLEALAYAQGTEIHLGPGQEKHLPHEVWHVVQQAQGRVPPTMRMRGVAVNDDAGLEQEAEAMGARAALAPAAQLKLDSAKSFFHPNVVQRVWIGTIYVDNRTSMPTWDQNGNRYHINTTTDTNHVTKEGVPKIQYFFSGTGMDIEDERPTQQERGKSKKKVKGVKGKVNTKNVFSELPGDVQDFIKTNWATIFS